MRAIADWPFNDRDIAGAEHAGYFEAGASGSTSRSSQTRKKGLSTDAPAGESSRTQMPRSTSARSAPASAAELPRPNRWRTSAA